MAQLLDQRQTKPIPHYSMRGSIMRRKWKKANVNTSLFQMLPMILMISKFSLFPECAGREIRAPSSSRAIYDSTLLVSNNATEDPPGFNWVIERNGCDKLDTGCSCLNKLRNVTEIMCRCDNESQIAHIKSPDDHKLQSKFLENDEWIWRFKDCSHIIVHRNSLKTVEGSQFTAKFENISGFTFQENAFATGDAYKGQGQKHVAVNFEDCNIDSFPTKTFPSYLRSIKLTRCGVRSLGPKFISALSMGKVSFEHSNVGNIEPEAFYSSKFCESFNMEHCIVHNISTKGIDSALNKLVWINSTVDVLEKDALTCTVANVTINSCQFLKVENNGFSVKEWNKVILVNNTFKYVAKRGIDLSHSSEGNDVVVSADLDGNIWGKVERDFITTGSKDTPFISVTENMFSSECECGNTFVSYLTTNGSQMWFLQELRNNSRCPVSEQVLKCLVINRHLNSTVSARLGYEDLSLLCDEDVYMCLNDVSDVGISTTDGTVPGRPPLPNRLRVLAYFIMVMGIFIITSLLITMCVFLCRKKIPRKKTPPGSPLQDMEAVQAKKSGMPKSLSGGEYADIVFKHNNGTSVSRPRSMLLEDVEMEDKGVQTMPTELSSEVLEGLREKLSKPDSFWDAKETIDHLYDLIQVKELSSGLSSPPDVTMCNGQSTTASTARLLPSSSSSPVAQIISAGVSVSIGGSDSQLMQTSNAASNTSSPVNDNPPPLPASSPPSGVPLLQRYAQIRNKVKTAPLCEYADPSDSSMHIYSELTPQRPPNVPKSGNSNMSISSTSHSSISDASPSRHSPDTPKVASQQHVLSTSRLPFHNGPILCEYTEPKDVQTHVYAELSTNSSQPPKSQPSSKSSSPVKSQSMKSAGPSPYKQSHINTITIAVPPPPIAIPHSNSFHNSPRHLNKIRETDLSSSNPSIATTMTPVKVIHVNDDDKPGSKTHNHRRKWPSEKLKRSQSSVDATGARSNASNSASSLQKLRTATGSDTQKRPLPSIPLWPNKNEAKSQF